ILRAPAQARHVYAGVCLGGHTLEDLDGSPSGLVSAFFQRGAVTVTGALVSIPDEGACLLALLFYRALLGDGLPPQAALERAKGQLARPEGIEDLLSGASLALLRGLRLGPFGQWLNRLYAGAGGSLAERGWASRQRERILERLEGLGIGSEARQDLVVTLEGLGGDRMALEDWLGQVAAAIPRRELLRPPPQPYLGALLHGMVSFGGRR
ncbi:MAG: CHAT domain-containing protein, partial [Gammaproteobacteria bacterium]|nr:CHAT domain-containing protein [Gammaproteobacteria bacterium]MBU1653337.1 CHAT domain-containing protein [Gammaproteobacteria bacterium]MBU1962529.1 CHAT domain-containing protein [Gammaproteobacteria bacterium]